MYCGDATVGIGDRGEQVGRRLLVTTTKCGVCQCVIQTRSNTAQAHRVLLARTGHHGYAFLTFFHFLTSFFGLATN